MTFANPKILGSITAEISYSNGSKRTITLSVEEKVLIGGSEPSCWYPGVMVRDDDLDAETVAYGINEGRVTHCDYRPQWSRTPVTDDEPDPVEMETWRVTGAADIALLREYGIVEEDR